MPVNTDAGENGFADDLLGRQLRMSWKSWLRDPPLPWLLAFNSTSILFTFATLALCLLLAAVSFISDSSVPGMNPQLEALVYAVLGGAVALFASVFCVLRRTPLFVEFVCTGFVAIVELFLWFGVVFIEDLELRQRGLCFLTVFFNTIPCLLEVRLLPNILMSVWVCAGNLVAASASSYVHGDDFSKMHACVIALCGFMYFCQARMHQFRLCCLYEVQRRQLEHISAMETVMALLSDGTAWLSSDGDTVCKSDSRLSANLGITLAGAMRLSDALLDMNEVERFAEIIQHAREGPALITTTLTKSTESKLSVEVLIANVEGTLHAPYLVCFRRLTGGGPSGRCDAFRFIAMPEVEPSNFPAVLAPEKALVGFDQQDVLSVPETTSTGRLFESIQLAVKENKCSKKLIDQVVDLGVREHWLLQESQIDFKRNVILGSGGFGTVIEADYLGLRVAVKVPRSSRDGKSKLSFTLNELRVLRCVRHPNVVLFFGAYISAHNHDVGLVFERIEGESLDRCVESLSRPSTKLRIALNLSCALRYLHSHTPAIVHGDIKTANVLTQGRGDSIIVKLADFGLSRLVSVTTRVLGGSLRWLAPEVIRSSYSGRPTRSADMFSFGRLLFCIIFGTNEFCDNVSPCTIRDMACLNIVMPFRELPRDMSLFSETCALCEACILADSTKRPTIHTVHSELASWSKLLGASSGKFSL